MRAFKNRIVIASVIVCLLFFPLIVYAQIIKTTVADILSNPDRYDGKIVQVEGKVLSLKFKVSKRGNPYTTFKLRDASGSTLTVFSFGALPIKEGDLVRVRGKYQKVKYVGPYVFYDEIDASEGNVEKVK